MVNNIEFFKKTILGIEDNLSVLDTEKETAQEQIKRNIAILNSLKEPINNLIKETVTSLLPIDNKDIRDPLIQKLEMIKQYYHLDLSSQNPFEEFGFNDLLYRLSNPINLDDFIDNLIAIIKKLNGITGVKVDISNFNYSYYVKKFMTKFFENMNNEDINAQMKNVFDKIYWKNHYILSDITINLRDILQKYNKEITAYINNLRNTFVKNNSIDEKNIDKEYKQMYTEVFNLEKISAAKVYDLFHTQELLIDDYQDDSSVLASNRSKLIKDTTFNEFNEIKKEEFYKNIEELDFILYEYEKFEEFKFLISDIKKIGEKKATIAAELATKNKTIATLKTTNTKNFATITKLNLQKEKLIRSNKEKKLSKLSTKIDDLILSNDNVLNQIRIEYSNYDDLVFEDKVCKTLNDKMTIYEIFSLYLHDLNALRKSIVKKDKVPLPEEEITELLAKYVTFMKDPRKKIINVINYLQIEEINKIIEEKYKLLDINVDIVKITDTSFKDLKKACMVLINYNNIYKSGWTPLLIKTKMNYLD